MRIGLSGGRGACRGLLGTLLLAGFSLPAQAGTTPGAIPGRFGVDATGAATYNIPFNLPPGINGLTPQLGLGYHSRRGNGAVGVGWASVGR